MALKNKSPLHKVSQRLHCSSPRTFAQTLWDAGLPWCEFSESGTASSALQNEEKADSCMKKGFVEEVSLELTFRIESSVIVGTPSSRYLQERPQGKEFSRATAALGQKKQPRSCYAVPPLPTIFTGKGEDVKRALGPMSAANGNQGVVYIPLPEPANRLGEKGVKEWQLFTCSCLDGRPQPCCSHHVTRWWFHAAKQEL